MDQANGKSTRLNPPETELSTGEMLGSPSTLHAATENDAEQIEAAENAASRALQFGSSPIGWPIHP